MRIGQQNVDCGFVYECLLMSSSHLNRIVDIGFLIFVFSYRQETTVVESSISHNAQDWHAWKSPYLVDASRSLWPTVSFDFSHMTSSGCGDYDMSNRESWGCSGITRRLRCMDGSENAEPLEEPDICFQWETS